ncbi:hypothetical protein [Mucilaginibacter polytrichastri]|uniref:GAF domain-containing protein n=1 Tax=Mucilaginibacter polytrichastri TaxID=1302689 RepID=A0A1Q6A347_9SPHI|nr:hypothetical protein [Mucilaginibacter polytrichastri]OKS88444.1 hypothetical protein RG47T_3911 [Mucilaginibacter polytrichastri]SFT14581.1 hypothetical protein SAMN04487890_112170 [Mucilaginibacter polytrichastri]
MQFNVFHIDKKLKLADAVDAAFSFHVFANDLKRRVATEQTIKAEFYKLLLNKIAEHPELQYPIAVEDAAKYKQVLETIYAVLSPPIVDEANFYWGIGMPIPGDVVYGTDAFVQFITDYNADPKTIINQGANAFNKRLELYIYRLVLEKLYHISSDVNTDTIYQKEGNADGLEKYFSIHMDTSFVEVTAKQTLPELKADLIEEYLQAGIGAEALAEVIPLSMFRIEGFAIITIEDITADQSIENIRLALVNDTANQNDLFEQVTHALQTLTGNSSVEFGLLPFLKVNGKLVYDTEECFTSVLVKAYADQHVSEETYGALTQAYIKNPKALFYNEIYDDKARENIYLQSLKKAGIISYGVMPVYHNRKLAGVMEIYSKKDIIHYEKLLSKLEAAVPLLSQLLNNSIVQFNERIEDIIKDKFTTLQQSVEWKFNEVAWNYIRQRRDNPEDVEIKTISFKNVTPHYGAIDIRSSTAKRNIALQQDLSTLLNKLSDIFKVFSKIAGLSVEEELIKQCEAWLIRIGKQITDSDELNIKEFLEIRIYPVLDQIKVEFPETKPLIDAYFEATNELTGEGFAGRRELEESMTMINTALNNYFERAQGKLQQIYPCYFEKFRTDGVEYDIYTGQSLAPDQPFDPDHLGAFRRWQLKSMIKIAQITGKLTGLMKCKLETTQLIFVHSAPIDICFRKDERRFDVEGAYNIRYEVIKKRIDKVLIKDTDERLTQPGTIALIYSSDSEADEFMPYIKEFQDEKMLSGIVEHHNLEELQGVTGLKALRLNVETHTN